MQLTPQQIASFHAQGYVVLDRVIAPVLLEAMQQECQRNLQAQLGDMERVGATTLGLSQRDRRYFVPDRFEDSAALTSLLFGPVVEAISVALLGPDAYLMLDLFVVKAPQTGSPFAWHQDGGYLMGTSHRPYITLWCALDDMSEDNGTLRILPYGRSATRGLVAHRKDRDSSDFVGYDGDDPGNTVAVERGSIIVLASDVMHCSGTNTSGGARRAYVASITPEPVLDESGQPWNFAVPLVRAGRSVAPPAITPADAQLASRVPAQRQEH